MIKLQIIGHLGKDALVNNVNGKNVINFSVAHSEKYKDNSGAMVNKSTWCDCSYWTDKTAIAPYLKQGTMVFVEGQPDARAYTTKEGRSGATLNVRVANIQLLGSKNENGGGNAQQSGGGNYSPQQQYGSSVASDITEPMDDDPF